MSTSTQNRTSRDENLALLLGGIGFAVGAVLALFILKPQSAIFGRGSVGELGAFVAFFAAGIGFLIAMRLTGFGERPWLEKLSRPRRFLDQAGLALVHASFAFFAATAVYAVFSGAFRTLDLDRYAGAFTVGLVCAIAAYVSASSATTLTTESLSVLVALFLVVGSLASALSSSDPQWWQQHFSALGAASDRSGVLFNFTLILSGLVLMALADFLTHDLSTWAEHHDEPVWKVRFMRAALVALGLLLGMVGMIPVNLSMFWHNMVTYGAIGVFAVLLVSVPILFKKMPGGFIAVTLIVVALLAGVVYLHLGAGYLNITAFEMGAVSSVFVWLLLFIRTVTAAVNDVPTAPAQVSRVISTDTYISDPPEPV